MNVQAPIQSGHYGITIEPLKGTVSAYRNGKVLARSARARVMYETRIPAAIYFPREDLIGCLCEDSELQTFCPFKGTANYLNVQIGGETLKNAVWSYGNALPEAAEIEGFVAFMPGIVTDFDLGENALTPPGRDSLSGPIVNWLLREAAFIPSPEELVAAFAQKLSESGVALSRMSVMIWSLHPMIAARNFLWMRDEDSVQVSAPPYEIHNHPDYLKSPIRHVAAGLGGVRQKINVDYAQNSFPIIEDLRRQGATDYVAMPLIFSDGRIHVMTLTSDHPEGFTTANLGMIFEMTPVLGRYLEVFTLRDNAQTILDTYVGRRTGARVLGGEIRRGDGDEIDAAIMFCDLRGSTALEERLGRKAYITLLNQFFDTVSGQVVEHGGEVLKFIGDAVLAVFPAGDDADLARRQALLAARAIVGLLDGLVTETDGHRCDCAIGLAFGRVTYGNVGSEERLDFTVIGQPANIAARLGDYGKRVGARIVATGDIALHCDYAVALGELELHNVSRRVSGYSVPHKDPVLAR